MREKDPKTPKAKLKLSILHFPFTFLHEVSLMSKSHLRLELWKIGPQWLDFYRFAHFCFLNI